MLIGFFADFNAVRKKRPGANADLVSRIQHRKGQSFLIRQALMPAQPELFLTAQAVDVAGFGEVGGFHLAEEILCLRTLIRSSFGGF